MRRWKVRYNPADDDEYADLIEIGREARRRSKRQDAKRKEQYASGMSDAAYELAKDGLADVSQARSIYQSLKERRKDRSLTRQEKRSIVEARRVLEAKYGANFLRGREVEALGIRTPDNRDVDVITGLPYLSARVYEMGTAPYRREGVRRTLRFRDEHEGYRGTLAADRQLLRELLEVHKELQRKIETARVSAVKLSYEKKKKQLEEFLDAFVASREEALKAAMTAKQSLSGLFQIVRGTYNGALVRIISRDDEFVRFEVVESSDSAQVGSVVEYPVRRWESMSVPA